MKIFESKNIFKKILLALVIIILFEFSTPNNVSKASSDNGWGGTLFLPIQSLTLALGDVCETILNLCSGNNVLPVLTLSKTQSNSTKIVNFLMGGIVSADSNNALVKFANKASHKISKMVYKFTDEDFTDEVDLPVLAITPDKIFRNQVPLLDINIINPNTYEDDEGNKIDTPVSILQSTISLWYRILRDIAIVAFLSVLVYVGIRIIISSTAEDKSKYKQMLSDWVVGLCLLFVMHYIMSFAIIMIEKVTDLVDIDQKEIIIESDDVNLSEFNTEDTDTQEIIKIFNDKETEKLNWRTDLAGYVRFNAQTNINSSPVAVQMAYTLMYMVLVIYTLMFLFQYLKRLFNIVLLTLISPIIALSYPLDKLSDGSAQAFNIWMKEYIFNLLLQPMHLILYTVLVGSAMNLVTDYPLYGIIVLGCLLQTEKLIRRLFRFDSANTTSSAASGIFTGAAVMQGINAVVNRAKSKDNKKISKGSSGGKADDSNQRVRMANTRTANDSEETDKLMRNALGQGSSDYKDVQNDNQKPVNDNYIDDEDNTQFNTEANGKDDNKLNSGANGKNDTQFNPGVNGKDDNKLNPGQRVDNVEASSGQNSKNDDFETQPDSRIRLNSDNEDLNNKNGANSKGSKTVTNGNRSNYTETQQKDKKNKRKIGKFKMAKAAVKMVAPKVGKTLVKGAAMAVGAGTLGMVGVGAGLASDDSKDILKYGAAGISGGALVGNVAAKGVLRGPSSISDRVQAAREEIAREAYKNDPKGYKQYLNEKADNEFLKSKEIRNQYAEAFGEKQAVEMMNNAREYRKHGITDNDVIIKAMKEQSGDIGKTSVTDSRRIAAAKLASGISNGKDIENMTKRLKKQGYKDNIIDQNEEFIRSIKGLKYN